MTRTNIWRGTEYGKLKTEKKTYLHYLHPHLKNL